VRCDGKLVAMRQLDRRLVTVVMLLAAPLAACGTSSHSSDASVAADGGGDAATGDGSDVGGGFESGSRLHAHYYQSGSAKQFIDFRDTELDVHCRFTTTEDGELRCVPFEDASHGALVAYSDDACTKPVAYLGTSAGCEAPVTPRFALEARRDEDYPCGGPSRMSVFRVGDQQASVPEQLYWQGREGIEGCVLAEVTPDRVWAVAKLAPGKLVSARPERVAKGRLSVTVLRAEDGSSAISDDLYDDERDWACRLDGRPSGGRCLPAAVQLDDFGEAYYADANCTSRAVLVPASCHNPPPIATDLAGSSDQSTYYLLGPEIPTAYNLLLSFCNPLQTPGVADLPAYALGDELPESTFAAVKRAAVSGDEPTLEVDALQDGTLLGTSPALVWLGGTHPCEPTDAVDGTLRCVGGLPVITEGASNGPPLFADEACTVPVVIPTVAPRAPDSAPKLAVYMTAADGCGHAKVSGAGPAEQFEGQNYLKVGDTCNATTEFSGVMRYRLGNRGDLSLLPVVEESD
jgi:hypothetical protein